MGPVRFFHQRQTSGVAGAAAVSLNAKGYFLALAAKPGE